MNVNVFVPSYTRVPVLPDGGFCTTLRLASASAISASVAVPLLIELFVVPEEARFVVVAVELKITAPEVPIFASPGCVVTEAAEPLLLNTESDCIGTSE